MPRVFQARLGDRAADGRSLARGRRHEEELCLAGSGRCRCPGRGYYFPCSRSPHEESAASTAAVPFGKLPAHFEPGTSPDTYTIRRAGLHLRLDTDGADMRLTRGSGSSVLSLTLEGAAPRATRPENLLPGVSNYFIGDDPRAWRTGVPHYARVRYVEVYPGIDLVYYSADGELEYDFLLAPGADAARIRMSYDGAHAMHVDESGDLRIAIDGGEVVHRKPLTYQMVDGARRVVDSAFRILHEAGREFVSFSLGDYDARLPLTIDPVLSYATYLGGGDDVEAIAAMVVDAAGAAYVAGQTNSVDFPVTAGVVQPARAGSNGTDAFVAKLNPAGTAFEYVTYLGGAGQEDSFNLRVDAGGNAYVAGSTTSVEFPGDRGRRTGHVPQQHRSLRHATQRHGHRAAVLHLPGWQRRRTDQRAIGWARDRRRRRCLCLRHHELDRFPGFAGRAPNYARQYQPGAVRRGWLRHAHQCRGYRLHVLQLSRWRGLRIHRRQQWRIARHGRRRHGHGVDRRKHGILGSAHHGRSLRHHVQQSGRTQSGRRRFLRGALRHQRRYARVQHATWVAATPNASSACWWMPAAMPTWRAEPSRTTFRPRRVRQTAAMAAAMATWRLPSSIRTARRWFTPRILAAVSTSCPKCCA